MALQISSKAIHNTRDRLLVKYLCNGRDIKFADRRVYMALRASQPTINLEWLIAYFKDKIVSFL